MTRWADYFTHPLVGEALVAAGFGRLAPALRRMHRHLPALNVAAGALIIAVGVVMLAGAYQGFFVQLIRLVPWTPPL